MIKKILKSVSRALLIAADVVLLIIGKVLLGIIKLIELTREGIDYLLEKLS